MPEKSKEDSAAPPDNSAHDVSPAKQSGTGPNASNLAQEPVLSFEAGLKQLESIVKEMESTELPLERALELFERGMKLSETCRKQLEQAETRVEILVKRGSTSGGNDRIQPQPFRTEKP